MNESGEIKTKWSSFWLQKCKIEDYVRYCTVCGKKTVEEHREFTYNEETGKKKIDVVYFACPSQLNFWSKLFYKIKHSIYVERVLDNEYIYELKFNSEEFPSFKIEVK